MTIPLNDLLVKVKWEEEGAQVPERVRAQLLQLANLQAALLGPGAAPGAPAGAPLRAGAGRNPFQSEWASTSQILQAMARDAERARGAVTGLGTAALGGARGTSIMRTALTGLAIQATGTSGPVGRLASGLLLFAGGSGLVLGVAAGIGIIATAYQLLTRETREATAAQEKLREKLAASAEARRTARTPETEQIALEQEQRRTRFAELNTLIADRQRFLRSIVPNVRRTADAETEQQALARLLAGDQKLNALYAERRLLGRDLVSDGVSAADAAKKEADERTRSADEARRLKLELLEIAAGAQSIARTSIRGGLSFLTDETGVPFVSQESLLRGRRRAGVFTPPEFGAGGLGPSVAPLTFANIRRNVPRFVAPDTGGRGVDSLEIAQLVAASLLSAAHGGAGGILGAVGGLASGLRGLSGIVGTAAVGPLGWIGLGSSLLSSLFGGLFGGHRGVTIEEFSERALAQQRQAREGLDRFTLQIISASTGELLEEIQYELGRRSRLDRVVRVPRGVILRG
jgi:hypothetical protein